MKELIKQYANEVVNESDVFAHQVPSIPLYMDQVLMMMDQMLSDNKRNEDDKIMTKTMINNYSKEKIIRPIKGKTYPKEQLIQLLMVYNMKNCLTMQEMKQVMQTMYMDEQLVTLLCLCTVSNQLQKIAYKLIDERFRASKDAK